MFEILALVVLLLAAAHKGKPKGRRSMGKYTKGRINFLLDLGTLAAQTLVSADNAQTVDEITLVSSIVATYSIDQWTTGAGIGPVTVGVAHSDYTDAEIEAVIENTGAWRRSDLVAQEIANRKVRIIGTFETPVAGTATSSRVLNDGKPIKTKLNWTLRTGQTLAFWAFNDGENPFATTDPDLRIQGHANLWER